MSDFNEKIGDDDMKGTGYLIIGDGTGFFGINEKDKVVLAIETTGNRFAALGDWLDKLADKANVHNRDEMTIDLDGTGKNILEMVFHSDE